MYLVPWSHSKRSCWQIYNELVSEMNINKTGLPLAIHRKKSVSFRDKSLLQIFQVALQTLSGLMSGSFGQMTPTQVLLCCLRVVNSRYYLSWCLHLRMRLLRLVCIFCRAGREDERAVLEAYSCLPVV